MTSAARIGGPTNTHQYAEHPMAARSQFVRVHLFGKGGKERRNNSPNVGATKTYEGREYPISLLTKQLGATERNKHEV